MIKKQNANRKAHRIPDRIRGEALHAARRLAHVRVHYRRSAAARHRGIGLPRYQASVRNGVDAGGGGVRRGRREKCCVVRYPRALAVRLSADAGRHTGRQGGIKLYRRHRCRRRERRAVTGRFEASRLESRGEKAPVKRLVGKCACMRSPLTSTSMLGRGPAVPSTMMGWR